jgi:hypothetical protein
MPYIDAPPPYTKHPEAPLKRKPIWKSLFPCPTMPFQYKTTLSSKSQPPVLAPAILSGGVYSDTKGKSTRPKPLFEQDFSKDHYNPDAVLGMDMSKGTIVVLHQKRG